MSSITIVNWGTRADPSYGLVVDGKPFGPLTYADKKHALEAVRVLQKLEEEGVGDRRPH